MGNKALAWPGFRCWVLDDAVSSQGSRCWVANDAAGCPWQSSCKSPRTLPKCKLLITKQLTFGAVLGEHKLSSPSTRLKVNHLCIRCLCFESVRGDLQEGHFYASRCHLPIFPSTKSGFLCFFGLRNPRFRAFRAQNRGFCALLPFGTPDFRLFEHKIGLFVLGKKGIGIGKNKYGRSCKSPRTPLKCKVFITRQLTFEGVLDELLTSSMRHPN